MRGNILVIGVEALPSCFADGEGVEGEEVEIAMGNEDEFFGFLGEGLQDVIDVENLGKVG